MGRNQTVLDKRSESTVLRSRRMGGKPIETHQKLASEALPFVRRRTPLPTVSTRPACTSATTSTSFPLPFTPLRYESYSGRSSTTLRECEHQSVGERLRQVEVCNEFVVAMPKRTLIPTVAKVGCRVSSPARMRFRRDSDWSSRTQAEPLTVCTTHLVRPPRECCARQGKRLRRREDNVPCERRHWRLTGHEAGPGHSRRG